MDELEDIMLSEISQSQKGSYCIISLTCGIYKSQPQLTLGRAAPPLIPAFWEAKGGGSPGVRSLRSASVKPHLYEKYRLAGCGDTCL